jgi:D-sedoheptulose 7-phosphate isomerase
LDDLKFLLSKFIPEKYLMKQTIRSIIQSSINAKQELLQDEEMISKIHDCVHVITNAFRQGNKILFCGNGGSAADAQHLAAEFTGRFFKDRAALPAEALHTNTSYLTSVANDYSFDVVYSRMVSGIGKKGDILVALSTSGNSTNIINAVNAAKEKEMITVGFTGKTGGKMANICNYLLNVPSHDTPRIQEIHILIGHIICELTEQEYFSEK